MKLSESTWPQVEAYLKNNDMVIVPVGSTEQHGPTGLIGTDFQSSLKIAEAVGGKSNVMMAPPLCYGMAEHHLGFPGTVSITPTTYVAFVTDIIKSLTRHGFNKILFINGHGGNIAPLTTAFSQAKIPEDEYIISLINWWHMKEVTAYESKHFGDENGFHATIGEVSVTMHTHPQAFKTIEPVQFEVENPAHHWPMSATEFKKTYPDGRMSSNPGLATAEHGKQIFDISVNAICARIDDMKEGRFHFKS